ncbi:hypothetical protein KJ966_26290 [bacterium]|nr:hypothetical protein [bacterium]
MDIGNRLFRLLKAVANDKAATITQIFEQSDSFIDETLREWERKYDLDDEKEFNEHHSNQSYSRQNQNWKDNSQTKRSSADDTTPPHSKQMMEDLQLFNLFPPVKLEEVKKARNREIKKFHPDKFLQEPEKVETAKRIIQIYNAAYDRLKKELI